MSYAVTISTEVDDIDHLLAVLGDLIANLTIDAAKGCGLATACASGEWRYETEERR